MKTPVLVQIICLYQIDVTLHFLDKNILPLNFIRDSFIPLSIILETKIILPGVHDVAVGVEVISNLFSLSYNIHGLMAQSTENYISF